MQKDSPWQLGGLSIGQLGRRVWTAFQEDEIWGRAAQLSYYFLLALFPALLFLIVVLGFMADTGSELRTSLLGYLAMVMPASALQLVSKTLDEVSAAAGGGKMSFGLLLALWAASNGMMAITTALNSAYSVEETRPMWKTRLLAIGLTLAISLLVIGALMLVLFGGSIAEIMQRSLALGPTFVPLWNAARVLVVLAAVTLAFALIYYFAPAVKDQKWYWITPGAVVGIAIWLAVSLGFRAYLSYFDSYSATYGSLGAVIILMLWFYLSSLAILIGGEINSEIESAAAEHGRADAKARGEHFPGDVEGAMRLRAEFEPTCRTRPVPGLRELWVKLKGTIEAAKRLITVLKDRNRLARR